MQKVLNLYKPVGIAPLQLINSFKEKHPEYRDVKLGYAGRLDPMAEGVLLVLAGDENRKRKHYEAMEKTYAFDCLFGVTTDTFDMLGLITDTTRVSKEIIKKDLPSILDKIGQQTTQQYPAYSSRTVNGKPLFYWARNTSLDEIIIPSHPIAISELRLIKIQTISFNKLRKYVFENIEQVKGDFRQKEILKDWEQILKDNKTNFVVASCFTRCSSGTYVRSICEEIGRQLNVCALALKIKRQSVGDYMLKDSLIVQ